MTNEAPQLPNDVPLLQEMVKHLSAELKKRDAHIEQLEHHACRKCGAGVTTAEKPPQPIEKGLGGPGLLADVVVNKCEYHMPLNRLEKKYEREGVPIARSTMADWLATCAWGLEPIFVAMRDTMLVKSKVIHTDDTPVPVLERGRPSTKTGRLWVYVGDEDAPFTVFDGSTLLETVDVNQELAPGDFMDAGASWKDLGTFTITADTLTVQLSNQANEYVIADAIRIERV